MLVPVVPVHMSEAWMLADTALLASEIGIEAAAIQKELSKGIEAIGNPKKLIEEILRDAQQGSPRRKKLIVGDLYQPVGQQIPLEKLRGLRSYVKFENHVRNILCELYLCRE